MNHSASSLRSLLTATFLIVGVALGNPVMAQENRGAKAERQGPPTKVLYDDEMVRVQEVTFKPGSQGPSVPRPFRVIRVLEGGTMQRIYPDGKTENVVYKTGETKVYKADKPFIPKNVGKSYIVLYVVALKEPKK